MKKLLKRNEILIAVFLAFVAAIIAASVLIIVFVKDYGVKSIRVNGNVADVSGNCATVKIEQAESANIEVKTKGGVKVGIFYDENLTEKVEDETYVPIGGKDAVLYVTTGNKDKVKKTYTLKIENTVYDGKFNFTVNGIAPKEDGNLLKFTVPYNTSILNIEKSGDYPFFTFAFYYDGGSTLPVTDLSSVQMSAPKTTLYINIFNANRTEVYKNVTVEIVYGKSAYKEISGLKVNGCQAEIEGNDISVTCERANIIAPEISISEFADYEIYYDKDLLHTAGDKHAVTNTDLSGKFTKLYIKAIAQDKSFKIYTLTVNYVLDAGNEIEAMAINDCTAAIDGNEIAVLINRCSSLKIDAVKRARRSTVEYFYDANLSAAVNDIENIDISDVTERSYKIYALVTAESGSERLYAITVNFAPDNDAGLYDLKVNNSSVEFTGGEGSLYFIGEVENFNLDIQSAKISKYSVLEVYEDSNLTTEVENTHAIKLNSAHETLYIKITAENGNRSVFTLNVNLISNDNEIKSITVNGQQFIVYETENVVYVEYNNIIHIDEIICNKNAALSLYYDALQTDPVTNLNDIKFSNATGEVYARVTAETGDVKVFYFKIIIKAAPTAVYPVNTVRLEEWQKNIPTESLFYISPNAYKDGQFGYEVFWDEKKQNTNNISVENTDRYYQLKIVISSPYFADVVSTKTIQVTGYTLKEVTASLKLESYSAKELPKNICAADVINLDCGSYVLGRDFYLEVTCPDLTKQIIVDLSADIPLAAGTYYVFVNAFNGYFESFKAGEFKVEHALKDIPQITADGFTEMDESDSFLNIAQLFNVDGKDYEIIMTHTYCNGTETDVIPCVKGIYTLKLQAYYANGVVEKVVKLEISSLSDNTGIDIFANGNLVAFSGPQAELQNLGYNESLTVTADNYNSRADIVLKVNGAESEFGELALQSGENLIEVCVTAENGDKQSYLITVTKNARALPQITANDRTITLKKFQSEINLSGCYSITPNDYEITKTELSRDGNKIVNDTFTVENISSIYEIEITLGGEFGEIKHSFNLSVLAYTGVDVLFKNTKITKDSENYVFSPDDFIDDIVFYGYNASDCATQVTVDGEIFTSSTLADGEHLVAVSIHRGSTLIKEELRYFVIAFETDAGGISVTQKISNCIIRQKAVTADAYDYFEIDLGTADAENIFFRYTDAQTQERSSTLTLKNGSNNFTLQIFSVGWQQLFSKDFCITCTYLPTCEQIFSSVNIDGRAQTVDGDKLILSNDSPLQTVNCEFRLNNRFSAAPLPVTLNLIHGRNEINFNVDDDGYALAVTLQVYNICPLEYYVNSVTYDDGEIENNTFTVTDGNSFDADKLEVNYLPDAHLTVEKSVNRLHENVYDITFTLLYDDVETGSRTVRIYIGAAQPRLYDIVAKVTGEKIIYSGVNEYNLELIAASDAQEIEFAFLFGDGDYTLQNGKFNNLNYGLNSGKFTVCDSENNSFEYDLKITLFENDIISSVTYDGAQLTKNGNYYIAGNASSIDKNLIGTQLKDYGAIITSSVNEISFNSQIVGVKIELTYNYVTVQTEYVAAPSDNTSIICKRYDVELAQSGNNILTDDISIDLSESENNYNYMYIIECVHPLTTIEADGIVNSGTEYLLNVDLSYLITDGTGNYTHTVELKVSSVSETITYKLQIQIEIFET